MTLKEMPKVGDKVRFIGRGNTGYHKDVTVGEVYEITSIGDYGNVDFLDDRNDEDYHSYISEEYFECFELVTEEAPRAESDLIANLALRVLEIEKRVPHDRTNAMLDFEQIYAELRQLKARTEASAGDALNGKILRIYTGTDVEDDIKTEVTVGIDEATGVMYILGMKTEVVE